MSEKLFSKKIHYLYQALKCSKKEFTKLFCTPKHNFYNRNITIHHSWLGEKGVEKVKGFDFEAYPIAKWRLQNQSAFSESLFTHATFKEFKERVDAYMAYKAKPKRVFEYRYIYWYDDALKKFHLQELKILEELNKDHYRVEVIISAFFAEKGIDNYIGTLKVIGDYYYLHVENSYKILSAYYMRRKGFINDIVYGMGMSISYREGIPHADKGVLSKKKLTEKELDEVYLISNERDHLILDEVLSSIYETPIERYIKKFYQTISNLHLYSTKASEILQDEIKNDAFIQILQNDFQAFSELVENIANNKDFTTYDRLKTIETFLNVASLQKDNSINSVYAPLGQESRIFDKNNRDTIAHIQLQIELAQQGLQINKVYILNSIDEINDDFLENMKSLMENGIKVQFMLKSDLDKLQLMSYDFTYDSFKQFASYKYTQGNRSLYRVTKNRDTIETLDYNYQKIYELSYGLDEFLKKPQAINQDKDEVLNRLIGEWYYYSYRPNPKTTQYVVSFAIITIDSTKKVKYTRQDLNNGGNGFIDTTSNPNQSFFVLTNNESLNLSFISFNNSDSYKNVFRVNSFSKPFVNNKDVLSMGLFSRFKLDIQIIQKTLGDIRQTILSTTTELDERINQLHIHYKSQPIQNNDDLLKLLEENPTL